MSLVYWGRPVCRRNASDKNNPGYKVFSWRPPHTNMQREDLPFWKAGYPIAVCVVSSGTWQKCVQAGIQRHNKVYQRSLWGMASLAKSPKAPVSGRKWLKRLCGCCISSLPHRKMSHSNNSSFSQSVPKRSRGISVRKRWKTSNGSDTISRWGNDKSCIRNKVQR